MCVYFQYFSILFHNYTSIQLEENNIQKTLFRLHWNWFFPIFLFHILWYSSSQCAAARCPTDSTIPVSSKFTVKISPTHTFNYRYYVNDSQILTSFPDLFLLLISAKYLLNISICPNGNSKLLLQSEGLSVSTKNPILLLSHRPPLTAPSYCQSLCITNFSLRFYLHIQSSTKCR